MVCSKASQVLFLCLFVTLYSYDSTNVNRIHTVEVAGSNPAAPTITCYKQSLYQSRSAGAPKFSRPRQKSPLRTPPVAPTS